MQHFLLFKQRGFSKSGTHSQWQSALFITVAAACASYAHGATNEGEKHGYSAWPLWLLIIFSLVTIALSAMYCGLTIGLLGMDTIILEIIADAGAEPDRTYAAQILPVRKLGHQLLATLLLGNMLTLVLTSQLVAAILQASELVNFIVGTLVILVFGEILPMSFCNQENNALWAGVKSMLALQVSIVLLYPIAKPLGMLLDCVISHDAGQLYDRNEIKKLIRVHCEKYSAKSGIDAVQVRMMLSALDMNEVVVGDAMTAISRTLMLDGNTALNIELEKRLWECGKSRVPVYHGSRGNIIGFLYVKDLINMSVLGDRDHHMTVRDFLQGHPRDVLVVPANTPLKDALAFILQQSTQILFVSAPVPGGDASPCASSIATHPVGGDITEGCSSRRNSSSTMKMSQNSREGTGTVKSSLRKNRERKELNQETDTTAAVATLMPQVFSSGQLLLGSTSTTSCQLIGVITLEDILEKLIADEIYDEDEYPLSGVRDESVRAAVSGVDGGGHEEAISCDDSDISEMFLTSVHALHPPRVNFYSFSVSEASGGSCELKEDQKWALAHYLTHRYIFFATWPVPCVRKLIEYVGDRVVRVHHTDGEEDANATKFLEFAPDAAAGAAHSGTERNDSERIVSSLPCLDSQENMNAVVNLYSAGRPTRVFTILLSGGITIYFPSDNLTTELRSFSDLGEEALMSTSGDFIPDYTAMVTRTSRYICITQDDIAHVTSEINTDRRLRGRSIVSDLCEAGDGMHAGAAVQVSAEAETPERRFPRTLDREDSRVVIE